MTAATQARSPSNIDREALSDMSATREFERGLLALIPHLRTFSRALCRNKDIAEDMAQDALGKAWRARARFEPGTNMKAWLFTILRHEFYSHSRRTWRQAPWDEQLGDGNPAPADEQMSAMNLSDCVRALSALSQSQREAVLMVGAGGYSYNDTAIALKTPIGTIKSRTARARLELSKMSSGERAMPDRSAASANVGMEDILAQLAALTNAGASRPVRV